LFYAPTDHHVLLNGEYCDHHYAGSKWSAHFCQRRWCSFAYALVNYATGLVYYSLTNW